MSSIIDDLRPQTMPSGKFWTALAALRDKDEEGYHAFTDAMFDPGYRSSDLQRALTKHTGIQFSRARISEVRSNYDGKEGLPV